MKTNSVDLKIRIILIAVIFMFSTTLWAEEKVTTVFAVYPTAIFPFAERGKEVKGYGSKAQDLLFAKLAQRPEIILVERAQLNKILEELGLGLSGIVSPAQATKIGELTGAKVLLTGSVFEVENDLYVVAKIIGTETSRVLGKSVTGKTGDFAKLVDDLAVQVGDTIVQKGKELVAAKETFEDRIAALNKALGDAKRPVVFVKVEERHVGRETIDPAAQTELMHIFKKTGFEVIDPDKGNVKDANVVIQGEGMSEFALRKGDLISVKARLEVKAIDHATDRIIAVDRQTTVAVDLAEQIAGKKAMQEAAADIAERLLPKLVKK